LPPSVFDNLYRIFAMTDDGVAFHDDPLACKAAKNFRMGSAPCILAFAETSPCFRADSRAWLGVRIGYEDFHAYGFEVREWLAQLQMRTIEDLGLDGFHGLSPEDGW
jgi:hypothetical protein